MVKNNIEYVSESGGFQISKTMDMKVMVPCDEFGDASAGDVAVGKTFTSANGLRLTGTLNSGNLHTSTFIIPRGRMKGDVNYDGIISKVDADLISRREYKDEQSREAADINGDGSPNINDANYINQSIIPKYKLTKYSKDILNKWIMREDFIAEPTLDYDYIFSTEIKVTGVTPNSTVVIIPKNFAEASKCGIASVAELDNDKIIIHTLRPPIADIECLVEIFEDGDGSAIVIAFNDSFDYVRNIVDGSSLGSARAIGSCNEYDNGENDYYKMGQYSFAEGDGTMACGVSSHAEGKNTYAIGQYSHTEGSQSTASGRYSHAEGNCTVTEGSCSHSEGYYAEAKGNFSHAEGYYTLASGDNQHVHGKYNIEDTENKYIDIAGNGIGSSNRSNAYTLDWDGNGTFAGKVTAGAAPTDNMDLVTKQYMDNAIAEAITNLVQQLGIKNME